MKNFLLFFVVLGLSFASCKKDNDHDHKEENYHVMMTIEVPAANAVVNVNEPMHIKVDFSRGAEEIIHHVMIQILDSSENLVETILEEHAHVAENFVYDNAAAWTPTSTGTFKVRAMSHDMEDNATDPVLVKFTVQ